jgi:hypothetical protein
VVEKDSDGVTVTTPDLPLYGYGDDLEEALANLKIEIQSLFYEDLMKDDNFSGMGQNWLTLSPTAIISPVTNERGGGITLTYNPT